MKKILITGAFGYLGGRLSRYLSDNDNYELYLTSSKKRENPKWLKSGKTVVYQMESSGDIFETLPEIDTVVHLASLNEVVCGKDPRKAIEINSLASFDLLQMAINAKVKRFVYLSTAHVYGSPLQGDVTENMIIRPTNPYSYTHAAVENYLCATSDKGDIEGVTVRLSNAVGAPDIKTVDRWMLLVNDLCMEVVTKGSLTLRSSGVQQRDFIGIKDFCRGIEHLVEMEQKLIGNGIFNLGGNCPMSVYDMAKLIKVRADKLFGIDANLIRPDGSSGETVINFSVDKICATGFEIGNSIKEEIDNLLLFCKDNFSD